jgi:hypothetical protein
MHDGTRWEPAVFDRRWSRMNHIRLDRHAADERIRPALGAVERRASGRVARLRDAPREHAARWAREAVARRAAELEEAQRHEVAAEPPAAEPVAAPRAAPGRSYARRSTTHSSRCAFVWHMAGVHTDGERGVAGAWELREHGSTRVHSFRAGRRKREPSRAAAADFPGRCCARRIIGRGGRGTGEQCMWACLFTPRWLRQWRRQRGAAHWPCAHGCSRDRARWLR